MENHWITVETIVLLFAILIAWVLNGFSVFLPYWIMQHSSARRYNPSVGIELQNIPIHRFYPIYNNPPVGIIPINYKYPLYFRAVTGMMINSFIAFFIIAGFFTFCLVSYYILHKNKATRIGYTILSIVSIVAAALQIVSFILMEICWKNSCGSAYGFYSLRLGCCPYLALASGIINLLIVAPAIHLSRTDFKKKETTQWTNGN